MIFPDTLPTEFIGECLAEHLVLEHNISPDQLYELKGIVDDTGWVSFLVRGHYILHKIETDGEYHDSQLHFYKEP